jgi:16S rRNA (adenine1518-N6/adenine1519-N6)-dimethyltransferase
MHVLAQVRRHPDKKLGQHFLTDPAVFAAMADQVAALKPQWVLEVGPGPGGVTVALLERGLDVVAIEYDGAWAQWLSSTLGEEYAGHLDVIHDDAVTHSWKALAQRRAGTFAVCGNLPYYVSSPLVAKLFEDTQNWEQAVLMLQKEVADRLLSPPGSRQTSALSVLLRYVADVHEVMAVPHGAFLPVPEVDSLMIK